MKIGILTYHKTTNYGAIFQAYALQKKIVEMSKHDVEIIDYTNSTLKKRYKINPFVSKTLKGTIKGFLNLFNKLILKKKFKLFLNDNLNVSINSYDEKNINKTNDLYDCFIAGSDQIWNLKLSGNDYNYYLDFVEDNRKKNSYAASFGVNTFKNNELEEIKEKVTQFNNISVREDSGVTILNELGIKSQQCIDPVFLLNKVQWEKLISKETPKHNNYILVYEITYTPNLIKYAKKYAKYNNCKVIFVSGTNRKIWGFNNKNNLSPSEFLMYLKNAKAIITSSFHGVALSVIFKKDFFYDLPISKGNTASRITSLINLLKIKNRNISDSSCDTTNIDYNEVSNILNDEIKNAITYLKRIVSD